MLAKRQEDRPASMDDVARTLRDVLARPDVAPVEAAPTVEKAGTTQPGRPEAPARAIGKGRPARGRALAVSLAAAGLATAASLMIRVPQAPRRETMVIATPRAVVGAPVPAAPVPRGPATRPVAAAPAQSIVATSAARVATPAPGPSPAVHRRARESARARASHPTSIDADGIVNL
jgi:hypothetical protein